jgi:hypothetical protein
MKKTDERVQEFLHELYKLFMNHGMVICGCGCCDSPWIREVDPCDCNDISEAIEDMTVR